MTVTELFPTGVPAEVIVPRKRFGSKVAERRVLEAARAAPGEWIFVRNGTTHSGHQACRSFNETVYPPDLALAKRSHYEFGYAGGAIFVRWIEATER